MTREEAKEFIAQSVKSDVDMAKVADALKALEQESALDELRAEITTLQNRCYALTKGVMCRFCKYECEYKAGTEADNGNDKESKDYSMSELQILHSIR